MVVWPFYSAKRVGVPYGHRRVGGQDVLKAEPAAMDEGFVADSGQATGEINLVHTRLPTGRGSLLTGTSTSEEARVVLRQDRTAARATRLP